MAYYSQQNRKKLTVGADGNALMNLIAILLMVFIIFAFIEVVYTFTFAKEGSARYHAEVFPYMAMPADFRTLLSRPWTFLTHPFLHDGVLPMLSAALWLWAFGYIYQDLTGYRKLIPLFLYGSYAGAIAFLLIENLIPSLHAGAGNLMLLGAGNGVMAIAVATAVLAPNFRIFPMIRGGIPLWVLTVIYAIIDLATIPYTAPGLHAARIAAAAMGFVFQTQASRDHDWSAPLNGAWDWLTNLFNPDAPGKRARKDELYYKATVPPYRKQGNYTQQRVDEILDKINQKGFKSLTEEEKEILKRASSDGNI
ncbi:rhomboid family intramembrane serine protease [Flaviaesturariibacter flavus]|uniref:Rhomboid family intramembrane serine protease n=1 Tax=Flaviaesturariibacter flavus TaxID=2502780 RepID=A0A4R1BAN6_9BACT|nr:rhomboid family intramembrane serine protease [Flaviaesturariibacter flavus]TCJ14010.1 rhomboid family intramembrane serine protease [Flaviaesturariibacter flavus]